MITYSFEVKVFNLELCVSHTIKITLKKAICSI